MGDYGFRIVVVGVLAVIVWMVLQRRPAFVIVLDHGTPRAKTGKVTLAALHEVGSLCRENGITRGTIRGHEKSGGWIVLQFSREFSPGLQQQIRNCITSAR